MLVNLEIKTGIELVPPVPMYIGTEFVYLTSSNKTGVLPLHYLIHLFYIKELRYKYKTKKLTIQTFYQLFYIYF